MENKSEIDQGLCIAPCSECDFWGIYEALWQTPFGLFCEDCFHNQIFIEWPIKYQEADQNE